MTLGERIKKVRKSMDLTQADFCQRIGLKRNSISLVESGKRNVSDQTILSICREFGVNEEWLRTGQGAMKSLEPEDEVSACLKKWGLPDEFRGLFLAYKELSESDQKSVRMFVRKFAEKILQQNGTAPSVSEPKNIHYWTREEMDAEYKRQMDGEEADRKKGTSQTSGSGLGNSGTATA